MGKVIEKKLNNSTRNRFNNILKVEDTQRNRQFIGVNSQNILI